MDSIQTHAVNDFERVAMKVSMVSIVGNVLLSLFKLFAGLFAHSGAMLSDAVHSASDVFSTIVVIIGVKLSGKAPDKEHPYGHERLECVAAIVLSTILLITGLGIGYSAVQNIFFTKQNTLMVPGVLALVAAVVSIAAKEAMFFYTHTGDAPWTVIKSNDKKRARLEAMRYVLSQFDYPAKDEAVVGELDSLIVRSASDVFEDESGDSPDGFPVVK